MFWSSNGRQQSEVASIRPDGAGRRTIRDLPYSGRFLLSPDASSIALTIYNSRSDDADVWLMKPDGTQYRNLTGTPKRDEYIYDWSPGSRRIAFERLDASGTQIYLLNVRSGKERRVVAGYRPSLSPDGGHIAYAAPSPDVADFTTDIFTMDLTTGEVTRLTEDSSSDDDHPEWSPAGGWLGFNRIPTGQMNEYEGPYSDIWRVRTSGEDEQNLTNYQDDYNGVSTAEWSPDGAWIAYNTDFDEGGAVYVMRSDGSDRSKPLSDPVGSWSRNPTWSPRGNHLAYERSGKQSTDIWTYDLASGSKKRITSTVKRYESLPFWASCQE